MPFLKDFNQDVSKRRFGSWKRTFVLNVVVNLVFSDTSDHRDASLRWNAHETEPIADCCLNVNTSSQFREFIKPYASTDQHPDNRTKHAPQRIQQLISCG